MTTTSAVSGSENWETYTDASDDYEPEPDARADYYTKMRTAKRGSPEDGYDSTTPRSNAGKKTKAYGLGIGGPGLRAIGHTRHAADDKSVVGIEGSEGGWTDDGEAF